MKTQSSLQSLQSLRRQVKQLDIPYVSLLDKDELLSFLSDSVYSLGWRWKFIKPVLQSKNEARGVMQMLLSPVRRIHKLNSKSKQRRIDDFLKNHSVVITLTTSPLRLAKITAVLATLDFTNITKINVVLPKEYGAKKETYPEIPTELVNFPKVNIVRIDTDLGPITKMLPTLVKESEDKQAIVISIDDDVAYPMGMINELIYQKVVKYPNAVLSMGTSMPFFSEVKEMKKYWPERKQKRPMCDIVEGWSSVLYSPNVVNTGCMEKVSQLSRKCLLSDDFVISYVLAESKIKRVLINNRYAFNPAPYNYGAGEDALHAGRDLGEGKKKYIAHDDAINFEKYTQCLQDITEYVRQVQSGKQPDVCGIENRNPLRSRK